MTIWIGLHEVRVEPRLTTDRDDADNDCRTAWRLVGPVAASRMPSPAHTSDRSLGGKPSGESPTLSISLTLGGSDMTSPATAQRKSIREVVGIGQVWQHRRTEFCIQIKQIHRADRLVEAWRDGHEERERQGIAFADLQREYELVEAPDVA